VRIQGLYVEHCLNSHGFPVNPFLNKMTKLKHEKSNSTNRDVDVSNMPDMVFGWRMSASFVCLAMICDYREARGGGAGLFTKMYMARRRMLQNC
jgi:hypothetical protein